MKNKEDGFGYNERLFPGGIRGRFHLARFNWISSELTKRRCAAGTVLELGCFDGKLIDHLPVKPKRYVGFDANWEGGLDLAAKKWNRHANFDFREAHVPEDMALERRDKFDIAVSMETLEHVPPHLVDGYLRKIADHLDGHLFVTVPNEKGLVFITKWTLKRLLSKDAHAYTAGELVNATLGRMERVERDEHKGFDYAAMVQAIDKHFDVISVSGHPFGFLPRWLCFSIGIVAKSRPPAGARARARMKGVDSRVEA